MGVRAQRDYDISQDFFTYRAEKLAYFDSLKATRNGNLKGTGYKPFMRWLQRWTLLVVNDGSMAATLNARAAGIERRGNQTSMNGGKGKTAGLWTEIGPINPPSLGPINPPFVDETRVLGSGRTAFLKFDDVNNRIFTGSSAGGLYYSEDNGQSWLNGGTDYMPTIGVSHAQIAKNLNNGETWFIATGDGDGAFNPSNGIWRTTDKGNTWENISQNNQLGTGAFPHVGWARCRKILLDPNNYNVLYAAFPYGVYKTTNALASNPANVSWTRVLDDQGIHDGGFFDLQFKPGTNSNTIVVAGQKLSMSTDAGSTWSVIADYSDLGKNTTAKQKEQISIRFSAANPDYIYGAYQSHLFKHDLSTSSTVVNNVKSYRYSRHQALATSPYNQNEVLIADVSNIHKTTDVGQNFSLLQKDYHDDHHWIEYRGPNEIWVANDGGVAKTTDGGQTWTNLSDGLGVAIYFNLSSSESVPNWIIGGGWDTGPNIRKNPSTGFEWTGVIGDAFESFITATDNTNPTYYVTASNYNFAKITSGNSLSNIFLPNSIKRRNWYQHFRVAGLNQDIIYYAGNNKIGRSMDGGDTWEPISFSPKVNNADRLFYNVWNNSNNKDYLYTQRVNFEWQNGPDPAAFVLYKSKNASANATQVAWSDITPSLPSFNGGQPIRKTIHSVAVDDENPNKIWITYPGFTSGDPKVLMYDGQNWGDITGTGLNGLSVSAIDHQEGSDDLIFVGTTAGVYYKKDNETSWTVLPGLPNAEVTDLEVNHSASKIRVSTFGRGIWEADLPTPTSLSKTVDLYLKDTPEDIGQIPSPGLSTAKGPDIWYRNQDDGEQAFESENLVYDGSKFWVYVRVRNNSSVPSAPRTLDLHWSRLGTAHSWPTHWNGTVVNGVIYGDIVGSTTIPALPANGSTVIKFEWDMSSHITSFPNNNISVCLLARINGIPGDNIIAKPTLYKEVKNNNNLAMKNLAIRDAEYFKFGTGVDVLFGEATEAENEYDVVFELPANYSATPLYEEAEVYVQLDQHSWNAWVNSGQESVNFEVIDAENRLLKVMDNEAILSSIPFLPEERATFNISANFLTEEVDEQNMFSYIIRQRNSNNQEAYTGDVHLTIYKQPRQLFLAEAGQDKQVDMGTPVTLSASQINESASYKWYDAMGNLIYQGTDTIFHANISKRYKLEIVAESDGFKDYDEVQITVNSPNKILAISPNPASNQMEIQYETSQKVSSGYLMIVNVNSGNVFNHILDLSQNNAAIDLTGYNTGTYEAVLVCDGQIVDSKSLMVQ